MQNRHKEIVKTSIIGIAANLLLAAVKTILGLTTGSIAILSDAINNLTDSSSSLLTIIGTKLAQRAPDKEHPFGFGRIEYLTSLIIGTLVLITGVEVAYRSVDSILNPTHAHYTDTAILILVLTVFVKIALGLYTKSQGKKYDSGALTASGLDALNDAAVSTVTILSALCDRIFHITIDGWTGLLISFFIIKSGYEVLRDTIDKMIGQRPGEKLTHEIIDYLREQKNIHGAYDLILNNYGPQTYIGSINLEVEHNKTVGELYPELHELQVELYKKFKVYLIFGLYPINETSSANKLVDTILTDMKGLFPKIINYHGVVIDEKNKEIYCDLVIDFEADRKKIAAAAEKELKRSFPEYDINITLDSDFS